ncbi:AI-2E family transporter [Schlegelella sp. S2-27]|uniref:AI-2E family transporter n=1 Tax=Caldimonas mangrovi TaxID=2944811 RepID=A0ABT0YIN7_9BURK|nr:AI-2E family transporter [Caldimonas mangrovi]MCM5678016.1 AI-2E family transporter [Caldimonas mangrovi]
MTLNTAQRQALAWLGIGAAALALLWLLAPVLVPFLLAAVLAYALHPAVEKLVARKVPRLLAVLLIETMVILLLLGLLLLMVPILSKELPLLREQIPVLAARLNEHVVPWLAQHGVHLSLDIESIKAFVVKYLNANFEDWLSAALSSARIGGSFVLAIAGNAVLVPVVLFYLLMDWPRVVERTQQFVPPRFRPAVLGFLAECDEVLGQYLRGQLLVMVILAAFYSIGLALFGFDLAVPVGVFTGLAIFIPYLGFGLGLVLALLAGVLEFASWYGVVAVAVVYGIGQVVESLYLTPRLVGERIGMHPITVIFALLAFGHLLGFVGVLVALPVSALLVVAVRRVRLAYLGSRLYLG